MARLYTSPGVYLEELESPVRTISGVPTSIAAFVGVAERGAIDQPTRLSSPVEYERLFGALLSYPLGRAINMFFENGGAEVLVVRAAAADATPATVALVDGPALTAKSRGAWGQSLQIRVDSEGLADASKYNITLRDGATGALERFVGISSNPDSPRSLRRVLLASSLVEATDGYDKRPKDSGGVGDPTRPFAAPKAITLAMVTDPVATDTGAVATTGSRPRAARSTSQDPPFSTFDGGADGKVPIELGGDPAKQTGLFALTKDNVFFNMLVLVPPPGSVDVDQAMLGAAAKLAQDHRAILIADAPSDWTSDTAVAARDGFFGNFGEAITNAAVYFPRVSVPDPLGGVLEKVGSSPAVAGICAATDAARGVWKAPAGITAKLAGIIALSERLSDAQNGQLNPLGVNCLRSWPVVGNVVWGARTMDGADVEASQWKYLPVRRLALFLEESLYRGTQWIVFEPNDEPLWAQIRLNVGAFMHTLFRQGAFKGTTANEAYFVKCDKDVNPQADVDRGIVNILVGFAPLKPAEFVVVKLQQITGQIEV